MRTLHIGACAMTTVLLASGCGDDGLDYQLGFTGSVQFGAYIQAPDLSDQQVVVDRGYVRERLTDIVADSDVSRYIL